MSLFFVWATAEAEITPSTNDAPTKNAMLRCLDMGFSIASRVRLARCPPKADIYRGDDHASFGPEGDMPFRAIVKRPAAELESILSARARLSELDFESPEAGQSGR